MKKGHAAKACQLLTLAMPRYTPTRFVSFNSLKGRDQTVVAYLQQDSLLTPGGRDRCMDVQASGSLSIAAPAHDAVFEAVSRPILLHAGHTNDATSSE